MAISILLKMLLVHINSSTLTSALSQNSKYITCFFKEKFNKNMIIEKVNLCRTSTMTNSQTNHSTDNSCLEELEVCSLTRGR